MIIDWNYEVYKLREKSMWWLARRVPKRLSYFVTMRQLGKATINSPNVMATPLDVILQNLEGAPK